MIIAKGFVKRYREACVVYNWGKKLLLSKSFMVGFSSCWKLWSQSVQHLCRLAHHRHGHCYLVGSEILFIAHSKQRSNAIVSKTNKFFASSYCVPASSWCIVSEQRCVARVHDESRAQVKSFFDMLTRLLATDPRVKRRDWLRDQLTHWIHLAGLAR